MELPAETIFQILLPLSWQDILKYCQTNVTASQVCQSEHFWNTKALQDYGTELSVITGDIPLQRYRTMQIIYESNTPVFDAIVLGQIPLLKAWGADYVRNTFLKTRPPRGEFYQAAFGLLKQGKIVSFDAVVPLIVPPGAEDNFVSAIYNLAAEEGLIRIMNLLNTRSDEIAYNEALFEIGDKYPLNKAVVDTIIANAEEDFLQRFMEDDFFEMLEGGGLRYESYAELYRYILRNYKDRLDLESLFRMAVANCPQAEDIYTVFKER